MYHFLNELYYGEAHPAKEIDGLEDTIYQYNADKLSSFHLLVSQLAPEQQKELYSFYELCKASANRVAYQSFCKGFETGALLILELA